MTFSHPSLTHHKPNPDWAGLPLFNRKNWPRVRFGDVVRQLKEQVDPVADGVERYVAGEHMETENVHIHQWGNVGDGYLGPAFIRGFRKGQVLYGSRRTYLKKVSVADWDGVTANTTYVLEADEAKLLQRLLPWLMLSDKFTRHSVQQSKGSTNPYINFPDIAKFEFDLPPLEQQLRIAEVLWAMEDLIQSQIELVSSSGTAVDCTRNEYFSRPGCDGMRPIRECGRWISGHTPSRDRSDFWNGTFPWVSPKDMKQPLIVDSQEHLSDEGRMEVAAVGAGCLLMVIRGMILAHTFPVGITQRAVAFNQDMKALVPTSEFSAEYLFHWFKWASPQILGRVSESSHGTKRLGMNELFQMKIFTPSKLEQDVFVLRLKVLESVQSSARLNAHNLQEVRAAFADQVFGNQ